MTLVNGHKVRWPYLPKDTHANSGHCFTPKDSWGYFNIPIVEKEDGEVGEEIEEVEEAKYFATLAAHNSA